jgi:hypothetical protein
MSELKSVIYKFQAAAAGCDFDIELPYGSQFVLFDMQDGISTPWVWFWLPERPENGQQVIRTFRICGTGEEIESPKKLAHVASAVCGFYVWHLFERVVW